MKLKSNYHVTVGVDPMNQIVVTNDRAQSFAMNWSMFEALFEPSSEDEKELFNAIDRRVNFKPAPEIEFTEDNNGAIGLKFKNYP
jgi:hypothetical protein